MSNNFDSSFNEETFNYGESNEENTNTEYKTTDTDFSDFDEPKTQNETNQQTNVNYGETNYNTGYAYNSTPVKTPAKETKNYKLSTVLLSAVLAALIGAVSSLGVFVYINRDSLKGNTNSYNYQSGYNSGPQAEININVDENTENFVEAVAQKVTPSVVGIRATASVMSFFGGSTESTGEGSGIIYTKDGYIITNYHVIKSAVTSSSSKITVYLASDPKNGFDATVVGYNISHDLAVLKISANNLPAIEIGDAGQLKVGQFVAAVGNPGGLEFMGSVTYGVISGLNRVISDSNSSTEINLIQTDAAINPGNSGGALVNIKGQLIGVNSSKIAATEYEGMGFAIPMDTVKDICDKIIDKENDPNPYIGVTLSERYDGETLQKLGFPRGAVVKNVTEGGPAYEAGIRSGDIIVEFNGNEISNYTDLYDQIAKTSPNSSVKVKIYRSQKYYTTNVKVGSNNSQ